MLQSIVTTLDRELDRLHTLRSIVAGLRRTPEVVAKLIASPEVPTTQQFAEQVVPASDQVKTQRKVSALAGKPRSKRTRKPKITLEPRAFAAAIPSGPVVFNPARLAEEKTKREQGRNSPGVAEAAHVPEDLDALVRSMAAHWGTARVQ